MEEFGRSLWPLWIFLSGIVWLIWDARRLLLERLAQASDKYLIRVLTITQEGQSLIHFGHRDPYLVGAELLDLEKYTNEEYDSVEWRSREAKRPSAIEYIAVFDNFSAAMRVAEQWQSRELLGGNLARKIDLYAITARTKNAAIKLFRSYNLYSANPDTFRLHHPGNEITQITYFFPTTYSSSLSAKTESTDSGVS
jgi:hypothetical protein